MSEAVHTVLAVREFQSKSVPDSVVRRIIESARLTGSSMNGQPWHFVVVQNRDTLVEIGSLVSSGPYNGQAAFAVAVAINKSSVFGISDASRAIQSMVLTAWSEGIGSNWTGWVGMTKLPLFLGFQKASTSLPWCHLAIRLRFTQEGRSGAKTSPRLLIASDSASNSLNRCCCCSLLRVYSNPDRLEFTVGIVPKVPPCAAGPERGFQFPPG